MWGYVKGDKSCASSMWVLIKLNCYHVKTALLDVSRYSDTIH